jgi:hypothetical protein
MTCSVFVSQGVYHSVNGLTWPQEIERAVEVVLVDVRENGRSLRVYLAVDTEDDEQESDAGIFWGLGLRDAVK